LNQSFILSIILIFSLNYEGPGFAIITLVSSATRASLDRSASVCGRSFI